MRIIKSVLILFLFSITFHTYAQLGSLIKGIDEFDLIGGPSLVNVRDDWWSEYGREKVKIGYALGVGARFQINNKMSLGGKILYERKGLKNESDFVYVDEDNIQRDGVVQFTLNYDYIVTPFFIRYVPKGKDSRIYIEGGAFIAYLIKEQTIANDLTRGTTQISNEIENYKKIDAGISLGFGYRLYSNDKCRINLQLTDNFGLIAINEWEGNKIYTNSLCLLVAVTFPKQ